MSFFAFVDKFVYSMKITLIIIFQAQKEYNSVELQVQEVCNNMNEFDLSKLRLMTKHDEPYDTEDLNTVPNGYR